MGAKRNDAESVTCLDPKSLAVYAGRFGLPMFDFRLNQSMSRKA
jgi:hypothetical protein